LLYGKTGLHQLISLNKMDRKKRKEFFELNGLRKGKHDDFEALFFKIYDTLYYLACSYVKVNEVAEDLVQDSFIQLWNNKEKLEDGSNTLNYLYTLTKHNCLNYLKHREVKERYLRNKSMAELKFLQQSINSLPDSFTDLMALRQDLTDAIEKLPDDQKEIFKLNRFNGLTYEKIAEQKEVSVKTVEAKMSRAIKSLRSLLKEYYPLIMFFHFVS
jgi:RNA polymerase sigma-70 factor (ECF subfamily)